MPTFDTPNPIDVAIDLQAGSIEVSASARKDTVVTVTSGKQAKSSDQDQRAAADTTVDFDGRRIVVAGPKPRLSWFGPSESIDVKIEVPAGSRLAAEIAAGGVRTDGTLGATRIKSGTGAVDLDTTGDLWLRVSHGNASVASAHGNVDITADHGQVRIGSVAGDALLRSSYGNITVSESGGELDAKLSYGDLEIAHAGTSVWAKTAYGTITLGEVSSGSMDVESGFGGLVIGVRRGVAAWLDLSSTDGRVRNELDGGAAPSESEQSVSIRARNRYGDIDVRYSDVRYSDVRYSR